MAPGRKPKSSRECFICGEQVIPWKGSTELKRLKCCYSAFKILMTMFRFLRLPETLSKAIKRIRGCTKCLEGYSKTFNPQKYAILENAARNPTIRTRNKRKKTKSLNSNVILKEMKQSISNLSIVMDKAKFLKMAGARRTQLNILRDDFLSHIKTMERQNVFDQPVPTLLTVRPMTRLTLKQSVQRVLSGKIAAFSRSKRLKQSKNQKGITKKRTVLTPHHESSHAAKVQLSSKQWQRHTGRLRRRIHNTRPMPNTRGKRGSPAAIIDDAKKQRKAEARSAIDLPSGGCRDPDIEQPDAEQNSGADGSREENTVQKRHATVESEENSLEKEAPKELCAWIREKPENAKYCVCGGKTTKCLCRGEKIEESVSDNDMPEGIVEYIDLVSSNSSSEDEEMEVTPESNASKHVRLPANVVSTSKKVQERANDQAVPNPITPVLLRKEVAIVLTRLEIGQNGVIRAADPVLGSAHHEVNRSSDPALDIAQHGVKAITGPVPENSNHEVVTPESNASKHEGLPAKVVSTSKKVQETANDQAVPSQITPVLLRKEVVIVLTRLEIGQNGVIRAANPLLGNAHQRVIRSSDPALDIAHHGNKTITKPVLENSNHEVTSMFDPALSILHRDVHEITGSVLASNANHEVTAVADPALDRAQHEVTIIADPALNIVDHQIKAIANPELEIVYQKLAVIADPVVQNSHREVKVISGSKLNKIQDVVPPPVEAPLNIVREEINAIVSPELEIVYQKLAVTADPLVQNSHREVKEISGSKLNKFQDVVTPPVEAALNIVREEINAIVSPVLENAHHELSAVSEPELNNSHHEGKVVAVRTQESDHHKVAAIAEPALDNFRHEVQSIADPVVEKTHSEVEAMVNPALENELHEFTVITAPELSHYNVSTNSLAVDFGELALQPMALPVSEFKDIGEMIKTYEADLLEGLEAVEPETSKFAISRSDACHLPSTMADLEALKASSLVGFTRDSFEQTGKIILNSVEGRHTVAVTEPTVPVTIANQNTLPASNEISLVSPTSEENIANQIQNFELELQQYSQTVSELPVINVAAGQDSESVTVIVYQQLLDETSASIGAGSTSIGNELDLYIQRENLCDEALTDSESSPAGNTRYRSRNCGPARPKSHEPVTLRSAQCSEPGCSFKYDPTTESERLVVHIRKTHQGIDNCYICSICDAGFKTRKTLQTHMYRHSGELPFPCDQEDCEKRFSSERQRRAHIILHHQPEKCPHECPDCGKKYLKRFNFDLHRRSHTGETPVQCERCGLRFAGPSNLRNHQLKAHTNDSNVARFQCDQCEKVLSTPRALKCHKLKIHGQNAIMYAPVCKFKGCGYVSANGSKGLERHTIMKHSELWPEQCHECERRFKTKSTLQSHIRTVHLAERPHVCPVCDKGYIVRSKLERHMKGHTGQRNVLCGIGRCTKRFFDNPTANRHRRLTHPRKYAELNGSASKEPRHTGPRKQRKRNSSISNQLEEPGDSPVPVDTNPISPDDTPEDNTDEQETVDGLNELDQFMSEMLVDFVEEDLI